MVKFINFKNFLILFFAFVVYTMLFPLHTRALTLTQEVSILPNQYQFSGYTNSNWKELYGAQGYYTKISVATEYTQLTLQNFYMQPNPNWDSTWIDWYEVHYAFSGIQPEFQTTTFDQTVCDQYSLYEDVSIAGTPRDTYACTNQWDNVVASLDTAIYNQYDPSKMIVQAYYTGGTMSHCIVNTDENSFTCPTKRNLGNAGGSINKIVITFPYSRNYQNQQSYFWFVLARYANQYVNASSGANYTTQITGIQNTLDDVDSSIQDVNTSVGNVNTSINNLNDSINDDTSVPDSDLSDTIEDWSSSMSSENAISDFILMPFTILNNISSGMSSRCETFNLGSLLGTQLVIPCINLQNYFGSQLWATIDSLFCIFMIYNIAMLFIQCFEGITTLRDDFDSLYTPQHGYFGYKPKHGGD